MFAFLKKVCWDRKDTWGKEYFVPITVEINKEMIRRYIETQEEKAGQVKLWLWMYNTRKDAGIYFEVVNIAGINEKIMSILLKEYKKYEEYWRVLCKNY